VGTVVFDLDDVAWMDAAIFAAQTHGISNPKPRGNDFDSAMSLKTAAST
jgi:hypothetical protein